jgi:hypothetical protein
MQSALIFDRLRGQFGSPPATPAGGDGEAPVSTTSGGLLATQLTQTATIAPWSFSHIAAVVMTALARQDGPPKQPKGPAGKWRREIRYANWVAFVTTSLIVSAVYLGPFYFGKSFGTMQDYGIAILAAAAGTIVLPWQRIDRFAVDDESAEAKPAAS